jgi:hypothetical protein
MVPGCLSAPAASGPAELGVQVARPGWGIARAWPGSLASNSGFSPRWWIVGLKARMVIPSHRSGQLRAGRPEPCAADGDHQGDTAAAQEQQQRGQSLLAGVVGQGSHRAQLV